MGHSLLAGQRYIAGEWSNSKSPRKVVDWFDLFFRTKWVRLPSLPLNLTTIWAAFPFSIAKFRKMNRQSSLPTFLEVMYLIHIFPFLLCQAPQSSLFLISSAYFCTEMLRQELFWLSALVLIVSHSNSLGKLFLLLDTVTNGPFYSMAVGHEVPTGWIENFKSTEVVRYRTIMIAFIQVSAIWKAELVAASITSIRIRWKRSCCTLKESAMSEFDR